MDFKFTKMKGEYKRIGALAMAAVMVIGAVEFSSFKTDAKNAENGDFTVAPASTSIQVGESTTYSVTPTDADEYDYTYATSSSNAGIVQVNGNTLTGAAEGTATITVTVDWDIKEGGDAYNAYYAEKEQVDTYNATYNASQDYTLASDGTLTYRFNITVTAATPQPPANTQPTTPQAATPQATTPQATTPQEAEETFTTASGKTVTVGEVVTTNAGVKAKVNEDGTATITGITVAKVKKNAKAITIAAKVDGLKVSTINIKKSDLKKALKKAPNIKTIKVTGKKMKVSLATAKAAKSCGVTITVSKAERKFLQKNNKKAYKFMVRQGLLKVK